MATTQQRTVIEIRGMRITIPSDESIYVEIGDKTFYLDDSTDEAIMEWWPTKIPPAHLTDAELERYELAGRRQNNA